MASTLSNTPASKCRMPGEREKSHLGKIPFLELPLPPRAAKGMHQPAHTAVPLGHVHALHWRSDNVKAC